MVVELITCNNRKHIQMGSNAPVVLRAALGELDRMALPLQFRIVRREDIEIKPILKSDHWNAQGMEGAFQIRTTWAKAFVLSARMLPNRWSIKPIVIWCPRMRTRRIRRIT